MSPAMDPERWRRINELFHATREMPEFRRDEFLRAECGEDLDLYSDVAHMLREDSESGLLDHAALPRMAPGNPPIERLLILDRALKRLADRDGRQARLVEMIYFRGLTTTEAGELLGISERTVKREWQAARAWLRAQLGGSQPGGLGSGGTE
jgi:DNA-directed RNA polymerase specialized sigma24 family protein